MKCYPLTQNANILLVLLVGLANIHCTLPINVRGRYYTAPMKEKQKTMAKSRPSVLPYYTSKAIPEKKRNMQNIKLVATASRLYNVTKKTFATLADSNGSSTIMVAAPPTPTISKKKTYRNGKAIMIVLNVPGKLVNPSISPTNTQLNRRSLKKKGKKAARRSRSRRRRRRRRKRRRKRRRSRSPTSSPTGSPVMSADYNYQSEFGEPLGD